MVAYFSSIFTKQVRVAISVALLALCLLGTHWIGFAHSISHGNAQTQLTKNSCSAEPLPYFSHGSDACHAFDALSLAGFLPTVSCDAINIQRWFVNDSQPFITWVAYTNINQHQPRAPPSLIL